MINLKFAFFDVLFQTLAPGQEYEGQAFGCVCMSVRARHSKTIVPFDMNFLHEKYYPRGSVLL